MSKGSEVLKIYREERDLMERWYTKARASLGKKPACRQGCVSCCVYDQPPLTMLEATALVHYCRTTPGFEDVLAAVEKAGEELILRTVTTGQKWMERTNPLQCCPFLDRAAGRCRIYHLRPTACVFAYSEDAEKCAANIGRDDRVGWDPDMDEQDRIMTKMIQLLPRDTRQRFERLLRIRHHNNTGSMMLTGAMAVVMRPDLHQRLVKYLQAEAAGVK
jgi:Fe-S-cluster containining protein